MEVTMDTGEGPSADNTKPFTMVVTGRPPGRQKKRKAEEELSTNPHSVKGRKRVARLTDIEKEIENAKKADRENYRYHLKQLQATAEYKNASDDQKKTLENALVDQLKQKRIQLGRHHSCIEIKYGYGEAGGFFAIYDDNNPAWEDEEDDQKDPTTELRLQQDDLNNGHQIVNLTPAEEVAAGRAIAESGSLKVKAIAFKRWQRYWKRAIRSFKKKATFIGRFASINDFDDKWIYHPPTNQIYEILPPHLYFSSAERAIFRNTSTWMTDTWYELPGPADWWPEDYDLVEHGFVPSNTSRNFERAFEIVFEPTEPKDSMLVLPGDNELVMMEAGWEATMLQSFFS